MTAARLLRLYPREWRERYGEEFLATAGSDGLHLQQVIDIVSGAIDAWLSSDVRRTTSGAIHSGEAPMMQTLKAACGQTAMRFTKRDAWIGCAALLAGTILLLMLGVLAKRQGFLVTGEILKSLAFPLSLTLSMPFTYLKGQPRRAQVVVIGGTFVLLAAAGYIASLI